jgi:hypothetical protein
MKPPKPKPKRPRGRPPTGNTERLGELRVTPGIAELCRRVGGENAIRGARILIERAAKLEEESE